MKTATAAPAASNTSDAIASWLFWGLLVLVLAMIVQAPASLLKKALPPNLPVTVTAWGGTLWNGQLDWQQGTLQGQLDWHLRPWQLLLGHVSADVDVAGDVQLQGRVGIGAGGSWLVQDMNGSLPGVLARPVLPAGWDLPGTLTARELSLGRSGLHRGSWRAVGGALHWQGGTMTFDLNGQPATANLPPLTLNVRLDNDTLVLGLSEEAGNLPLAGVRIGADSMMETQLRQRLLTFSPGYHGQGSDDQIVVTAKQPL